MVAYEVPVSPKPESFSLELANVGFKFTTAWCPPLSCWVISITLPDDTPVVMGIPVVTGVDLLAPYAYLGFGGGLIAQPLGDVDTPPTFENFGVSGLLFFVTP